MPLDSPPGDSPIALAMTGGGARAAYQVGVLRSVVRHWPEFRPPIITGVSAGAINAVALAGREGSFAEAVGLLSRLWSNLTTEQVLRSDTASLAHIALGWARRLGSAGRVGREPRALVDTAPLRKLLQGVLGADGAADRIEKNVYDGALYALGIAATNYGSGRSVTWVQGRGIASWDRAEDHSVRARIGIEHVMASSALPLAFPAIYLGGAWYGDGGMRQIAPLSPAVHLGAERILAVNTRPPREPEDTSIAAITDYPPPAQIIGVLMNAVFVDTMDRDAEIMRRFTTLVERLPEDQRDGLKPLQVLVLRPSQDLARLASEFEVDLPGGFRFLMRGLGTREIESPDWLSMLLFEPAYLQRVMEIGEADAEDRISEIEKFLGVPRSAAAQVSV